MYLPIIFLLYSINSAFTRSINSSGDLTTAIITTTDYPIATTINPHTIHSSDEYISSNSDRESRGMMMMEYDHDEPDMMMKEEQKAVKTDPWAGYYDFVINEGSFKFWAAFQLATAVLLIYSSVAAVYYAKFNPIASDYDYYDEFFFRSNDGRRSASKSNPSFTSNWFRLDASTFQRILNAITSNKYT